MTQSVKGERKMTSLSLFYARAFGLATAVVLGFLLLLVLRPFAAPIVWAALLAFMLQPVNHRLINRWHRPGLAAGLITGLISIVTIGPVGVFLFAFVRQATELLFRFQAEAEGRKLPALQLVLELGPVQKLFASVEDFTSLSQAQIVEQATSAAQSALQQVAALGSTVVFGLFSVVTQFALTMFLLFFFVRDGRQMLEVGLVLVPMSTERKDDLAATLGGVTRGVVLGTLITAVVQGTLIGIGFAIAGLPSPLVFGAVGALTSLIPVVGTSLVWVPACLSLLATGHSGWAGFLLAWSLVLVSGSDNVIRPLVVSSRSNVSTLLVFVGVLGGVSAFNFAGLFAGPVLLTLVAALLRFAYESSRRAPPSEPVEDVTA